MAKPHNDDGLYGTEQSRRLQGSAISDHEWTRQTPGANFGARCVGTDDPDRLGWGVIERILARDGRMTFRMISSEARDRVAARLANLGYQVDWYGIFEAGAADALEVVETVLASPLPADIHVLSPAAATDATFIPHVQAFMADQGIAPFPAKVLDGRLGPSALEVLTDANNQVIATSFSYFPFNQYSPYAETAWCGLVAVDPVRRGQGLGTAINARAIASAIRVLGAKRVQEYAAPENHASRQMIERCGLRLNPRLLTGSVGPLGAERFTR